MSIFGLRTSNPAFNRYFWRKQRTYSKSKMSISGIILKSLAMLTLVGITATYTWKLFFAGVEVKWYTTIGMFVAIVCSLFISFKHSSAKYLLPIYAVAKGFFLGGISAYAHIRFPRSTFSFYCCNKFLLFLPCNFYTIPNPIRVSKEFQSNCNYSFSHYFYFLLSSMDNTVFKNRCSNALGKLL